jgi:hypothetical protein
LDLVESNSFRNGMMYPIMCEIAEHSGFANPTEAEVADIWAHRQCSVDIIHDSDVHIQSLRDKGTILVNVLVTSFLAKTFFFLIVAC